MSSDETTALNFLLKWRPQGSWVLSSIHPETSKVTTRTFKPESQAAALQWLNENNGKNNLYFHVNTTTKDLSIKANKGVMESGDWLHIDVDPAEGKDIKEEQESALAKLTHKLPNGIPPPTVIIFSGGGYQGFWKLKTPVVVGGDIKKCEDFELYNKRLEQVFDADRCHNIDRIMRLPGTVNIPTITKLKKGRVRVNAELLVFDESRVYDISDFKKAREVQVKGSAGGDYGIKVNISGNTPPIMDLNELDKHCAEGKKLSPTVKMIISQGKDVDNPKEGDNSRSAWVFHVVCAMVNAGIPDDIIFSVLTDPEYKISESIIEKRGAVEKYAIRQIKRAKEHKEADWLAEMNERHAVIGNMGGKCRVIQEIEDPVLGRVKLTISSFPDIKNRYQHIKVQAGVDKDDQPVFAPKGNVWLGSKNRRQFDEIRFMPDGDRDGIYNLWQGFNFHPKPGNWELLSEHLLENICNSNAEYYDYLIKWMARGIQQPATAGEVAVVFRGGKGVGKGVVAKHYGKLFGRHALHIGSSKHLVGNFNAHLRDAVFLFADEAFFAGDRGSESVLKMLITEDSIPIEAKGIDVEVCPNYIHLMMAANEDHVIRASGDERRYFALDVKDYKKQDAKYFKAINTQMEEGGYEAFLFDLQNIDLEGFQVRDVPQTEELENQKMQSLSIPEDWWFGKLTRGFVLDNDKEWSRRVLGKKFQADFLKYASDWELRGKERGGATKLGIFIKKVCPHRTSFQGRYDDYVDDGQGGVIPEKATGTFYDFGTLEQARKAWENLMGLKDYVWEIDGTDAEPDPELPPTPPADETEEERLKREKDEDNIADF